MQRVVKEEEGVETTLRPNLELCSNVPGIIPIYS
jgi:hypothetical protein